MASSYINDSGWQTAAAAAADGSEETGIHNGG